MWETTSRAGPVESASKKVVVRALKGGDPTIDSPYCTEASSSFSKKVLPAWARPRAVPPGQTAADPRAFTAEVTTRSHASLPPDTTPAYKQGMRVESFGTGFTTNRHPVLNETPYDPVPHPLTLPPNLQRQALVSRRLELEGDVFGSLNSTTYKRPPAPTPDPPMSVAMEPDGFTKNTRSQLAEQLAEQDDAEIAFRARGISPGSTMLPSMKLTAKKKNPLDAENDFKGPSRFSTTYRTFFKPTTMARGPVVRPSNEYVMDADLTVGKPEESGFTKSVRDLHDHQLSHNETVALEPTREVVEQTIKARTLGATGGKTMGGRGGKSKSGNGEEGGNPNPLIDDAVYYALHPTHSRDFRTRPPTISQLSYLRPPQPTGKEDLPKSVFVEPSGSTLAYTRSLGRSLGSGAKEEWEDDPQDFDYGASRDPNETRRTSEQNGMGHEAEGMTQEAIRKIRASDPMEFEYLRIGNTMRSVSQLSYVPPPKPTATALPPSQDADFLSTCSSKISSGQHLSPEEREAFVGSTHDRHFGLGSGHVNIRDSETASSLYKEPSGFTENVLPYIRPQDVE